MKVGWLNQMHCEEKGWLESIIKLHSVVSLQCYMTTLTNNKPCISPRSSLKNTEIIAFLKILKTVRNGKPVENILLFVLTLRNNVKSWLHAVN